MNFSKFSAQKVVKIFALLPALLLFAKSVHAQIPPTPVPCEKVTSPEFHSLRPYQASPCKKKAEDTAQFCGNQLVIKDSVSAADATCQTQTDGTNKCTITRTKSVAVDLSDAKLPIVGNTENVVNSQDQTDSLDSADKTNDYVSWYLNGVIGRAEYPVAGISDVVDFSGPLKKLLPQEIQNDLRANTVKLAVQSKSGGANARHDQIIGCTYGISIFGRTIGGIPAPCYEKGLASLLPRTQHRLSEWENQLPPKASDIGTRYKDFQEYWMAYETWRGKRCFALEIPKFVPLIGGQKILLCGEDPTHPNYYSNLYSYIPFSSTEDKKGSVKISETAVQPGSADVKITKVEVKNQKPADLFFAHMEETNQLAGILQNTFVPAGGVGEGGVSGVSPSQGSCDLVNIRTNPGDNLFAGEVKADVTYTAEFTCKVKNTENACNRCSGNFCVRSNRPGCDPTANECIDKEDCAEIPKNPCTKDVLVNLDVASQTPLADSLWEKTVAGPAAIFKRIFPQVGEGGAILGILDIPAATKVTYSGEGLVYAGNPEGQREGESAELYFPHLGGVSEYFLKGIQTILRPKGYGEQIASGELPAGTCDKPGSMPNLSGGGGACALCNTGDLSGYLSRFGYNKLPTLMIKIIETAAAKYNVPGSLILGTLYAEGGLERYKWTDELVKKASICGGQVPNCSTYNVSRTGAVGPYQFIPSWWGDYKNAVGVVDPSRTGDPCNFMDATFALAKKFQKERGGAFSYNPPVCGGIKYNTAGNGRGISTSCSGWTQEDAATAVRQHAGACNVGYQTNALGFFNAYQCR